MPHQLGSVTAAVSTVAAAAAHADPYVNGILFRPDQVRLVGSDVIHETGTLFGRRVCLAAGLMFGPALLGLLADFTSVQTALCANAALLVAVMGVFALAVRDSVFTKCPGCTAEQGVFMHAL